MNKQEYLLTCLAEEAAEIIKCVAKIQRFGLGDKDPNSEHDNRERLLHELCDMAGVLDLLNDEGVVNTNRGDTIDLIDAKIAKVKKFMEYSKEKGTLCQD